MGTAFLETRFIRNCYNETIENESWKMKPRNAQSYRKERRSGFLMVQMYKMAKDVPEALQFLEACRGRGRIMAGGTDLVLDLQSGKHQAECLIDITGIPELGEIRLEEEMISIGAAVTHNQAACDPLIAARAHALAEASHSVGSHQIRNCSTLAGNVVNGQPAADSAVALAALGGQAEVQGPEGVRLLPMEQLYAGFGKSVVDSTSSLVTRLLLPAAKPGEGSAYARLQQRKALALPMLCVAAFLRVEEGVVKQCRIAMAPVGVGPVRAAAAERYLTGKEASRETFWEAGKLALADANPRDSLIRGSKRYREEVLPVMVERALSEACSDALNGGKEAVQA